MRYGIIILLFASITSGCINNIKKNNHNNTPANNIENSSYPDVINKLGKQEIYDELKWRLYGIECDRIVPFRSSKLKKKNITFGMLPLLYDQIVHFEDSTLLILFSYSYQDDTLNLDDIEYLPYIGGVIDTSNGKDSITYYESMVGLTMSLCPEGDSTNCPREAVVLQPDVIAYIKNNKDKLAPWFRQEAIKRGVIIE